MTDENSTMVRANGVNLCVESFRAHHGPAMIVNGEC